MQKIQIKRSFSPACHFLPKMELDRRKEFIQLTAVSLTVSVLTSTTVITVCLYNWLLFFVYTIDCCFSNSFCVDINNSDHYLSIGSLHAVSKNIPFSATVIKRWLAVYQEKKKKHLKKQPHGVAQVTTDHPSSSVLLPVAFKNFPSSMKTWTQQRLSLIHPL